MGAGTITAACGHGSSAAANVGYWHIADVPLTLTNVCFERKNGHDAGVTPFPLMTLSGHSHARTFRAELSVPPRPSCRVGLFPLPSL
jgi:hypothetical protein